MYTLIWGKIYSSVESQLRDLYGLSPSSLILLAEFLELIGPASVLSLYIILPLFSSLAITHCVGSTLFLHVVGWIVVFSSSSVWEP